MRERIVGNLFALDSESRGLLMIKNKNFSRQIEATVCLKQSGLKVGQPKTLVQCTFALKLLDGWFCLIFALSRLVY